MPLGVTIAIIFVIEVRIYADLKKRNKYLLE